MNIFQRFNIKPATGASMLRVPGDFRASTALDISGLDPETRTQLFTELEGQGLTLNVRGDTVEVEGPVTFEYSRGTDNEGRRALWLSASGPIVELIGQSLAFYYVPRGWNLSSGRVMREIITRVGGEVRLPDGAVIYVGETEDYNQSLLASDGAFVHPKFDSMSTADNATVETIEDPFK